MHYPLRKVPTWTDDDNHEGASLPNDTAFDDTDDRQSGNGSSIHTDNGGHDEWR